MHITKKMIAIAGVALVVGLAGCTTEASKQESADDSSANMTEAERSPLDEYLDAAYSGGLSEKELEKKQREESKKAEEVIAACMKEEGFEFFPDDDDAQSAAADQELDWRPDDRDWVQKHGYGIYAYPESSAPVTEENEPDRNAEYVDSLPESMKQAYYEAMSGPDLPDSESDGSDGEYDWTREGCNGVANHEVFGYGESDELDAYADLLARIDEVKRPREDSPEVVALNGEWSACMSTAGESGFTSPYDASASIWELLPDGKTETGEAPSDEEVAAQEPLSLDSPEMKAAIEREIELALIDLDCREKTEYAKKSQELQYAAERQFIEDNKAELDEFKLAAEQADG